jgi:hypothetical protein
MRKVLFLIASFAFVIAMPLLAADVSGTWMLTMQSPMGEDKFDVVIKAAGETLTVTSQHPMLQELKGTGTLKENSIKFKLDATGQMPIAFEFTGTVAGSKMSGTREIKFSGEGGGPGGGPEGGPGGGMGDSDNKWTAEKK